jgi:hypothetical protein
MPILTTPQSTPTGRPSKHIIITMTMDAIDQCMVVTVRSTTTAHQVSKPPHRTLRLCAVCMPTTELILFQQEADMY